MRRTRVLAGFTIAATVVALLPAVSAAAADPFANEAAGFARQRGITIAEAEQRLGWQMIAPDLEERLEGSMPSTFGAVWIDANDRDRVKVGVAPVIDDASVATINNTARGI